MHTENFIDYSPMGTPAKLLRMRLPKPRPRSFRNKRAMCLPVASLNACASIGPRGRGWHQLRWAALNLTLANSFCLGSCSRPSRPISLMSHDWISK